MTHPETVLRHAATVQSRALHDAAELIDAWALHRAPAEILARDALGALDRLAHDGWTLGWHLASEAAARSLALAGVRLLPKPAVSPVADKGCGPASP